MNQLPIDLAILDLDVLTEKLETEFEEYQFVPRIKFGGLIDIPNEDGSSRAQGPAIGFSYDLFNPGSGEVERLNLKESIIEGRLPKKSKEALLGHAFAKRLGIELGEEVTYFGSTMNGSMTFMAFTVVGTVRFGAAALDKGALIADISDVQNVLDMENGASELLGFLPDKYDQAKVDATVQKFETLFSNEEDEFAPVMMTLRDQNGLDDIMGPKRNHVLNLCISLRSGHVCGIMEHWITRRFKTVIKRVWHKNGTRSVKRRDIQKHGYRSCNHRCVRFHYWNTTWVGRYILSTRSGYGHW
jgi:hypothetical protein